MRIYLTGLTGCGKSTIGKQLALQLKTKFVDLDDYIILKEQMSIAEIFAEKGESHFRLLENKALKELSNETDIVIATGGGAPCYHDNMTLMNISGITIFLDVTIPEICNRLWNTPNRANRPMLQDKTKEQLHEFIEKLRAERIQYYNEAKLTMHGNTISVDQILMILDQMD